MYQRCRSRMKLRKDKVSTSPITAYFKKLAPDLKPRKPQVKISPITSYFSKSKQAVENRCEGATGKESNSTIVRNLSEQFLAQPDRKPLAALNTSPSSSQKSAKSCPSQSFQPNNPVVSPSLVSTTQQLLPPSELSAVEDSPDQDSFFFDVTTPHLPLIPTVPVPCSPEISTAFNLETPTMPVNAKRPLEHDIIMVSDSPLLADRSVVDLTSIILPNAKRMCLVDLTESPVVILDSPMFQEPPHAPTDSTGTDRIVPAMENGSVSGGLQQQPPEINITLTVREEEKTELSSSKESLCAIAKGVESFHLTSPKCGSDPDPPAIPELESEQASSAQVQLHRVSQTPPLSSSASPSLEDTSGVDSPELLSPPPISVTVKDELELLLWQRGTPYCKRRSPAQKVCLFGLSQDNMLENLMDVTSTVSSWKLHSVLEYLTIVTSTSFMPKASQLQRLWEMVVDPHVAANYLSADSLTRCITFFRRLLSLHPPGQHPLVDIQYSEFVRLLGQEGSPFAIWDSVSTMLSGPESCEHLLCFIVDILLLDFWACLSSEKEPLFVKVFWQGPDHGHITLPLRQLVDTTMTLAEKPSDRESELSKLGSCTSLLFMATTRCQDLSTELAIACRRLPTDRLLPLLSLIQPTSLQLELIQQTAPLLQCTLSSVIDYLGQYGPPIASTAGPMLAHTQQQCQPEEVEGHLMSGHYPPSSQSDEVTGVTSGSQDAGIHSVPTKDEPVPSATMTEPVPSATMSVEPVPSATMTEPVPSATMSVEPVPSATMSVEPVPSATMTEPVPSATMDAETVPVHRAVVRTQPVHSATMKPQPVPRRTQPVPRAVERTQPVPRAVVRAQAGHSATRKAELFPSATMKPQPAPSVVMRAKPGCSAMTKAQPIPKAVARAQPGSRAVTKAQPGPRAVTKAQQGPRAVTKAKPGPRAVTKAQPVAPSATMRAQPVVRSAVVKAQPVHNAMTRAHPKEATSVQPSSTMHQTVRSNVGNMTKGATSKTSSYTCTAALPRRGLRAAMLSSAERGPSISSHQPKPLSDKKSSTQ